MPADKPAQVYVLETDFTEEATIDDAITPAEEPVIA